MYNGTMTTKWHLRARAVIFHEGKFLLVRTKNRSHSYLIGGHVEEGESVPEALIREVREEAGRVCVVDEYLGAIENKWTEGDVQQWEITHFFSVTISDLALHPEVVPAEEGYDFLWAAPDAFETLNLLPMPLRDLMSGLANGEKKTWWASTMRVF